MNRFIAAAAAAILAFCACEPDNTVEAPREQKPSTKGYIKLDTLICRNCGNDYENETMEIIFEFHKDAAYDENGIIVSGTSVIMDLLTSGTMYDFLLGEIGINGSRKAGSIVASIPQRDEQSGQILQVDGSSIWKYSSDGPDILTLITGGRVRFHLDGTFLTLAMDIMTPGGPLRYAYEGTVNYEDLLEETGDIMTRPATMAREMHLQKEKIRQ